MRVTVDIPDVRAIDVLAIVLAAIALFVTIQFIAIPSKILSYRHHDKTWALVTGASDGIGYELVVQLASKGFNVILHGRNKAKVDKLIKALRKQFPQREFRSWILDASDRSSHHLIQAFKDDLVRSETHLSVLINNVGISVVQGANFRAFADVPESHIAKLIDVNAVFPTQLTHALLPLLEKAPSALVLNLGSAAGLFPAIYTSIYGACKAYQFHLTRVLRNELCARSQTQVEVMSVLIGYVESAGTKEFISMPSIFAPSSATYAKAIVDSVGCGKEMVTPYWPHLLQMAIPRSVPSGVLAFLVRRAGLELRAEEQKRMHGEQPGEPSKLAGTLES